MKENQFFAMLSRMRYVNRWGLMRNTKDENICEHSLEVAFIAHALGLINNKIYNGSIDASRLALMGMYHDVTEIITGDMPTPVKYYNPLIRNAYKEVEEVAKNELLTGLPEELREPYDELLTDNMNNEEDALLWTYVKAADKISALIKCIEEKGMGNTDFKSAELATKEFIDNIDLDEVRYFMDNFFPAYYMTLDESN